MEDSLIFLLRDDNNKEKSPSPRTLRRKSCFSDNLSSIMKKAIMLCTYFVRRLNPPFWQKMEFWYDIIKITG